ncbi:MAG: hypothetical protein VX768_11140 [Planctomycetota bacterium]|nr:hypothetical protein [Planctomycetota bacterium]
MNGILNAIWQLVILFGPLVLSVVLLQLIESKTQKRMTRHFGWKSNLWTGWLGTPIHEYSHALVAWLFGHQVVKVVPFQPDQKTGRLGYVVIRNNPNSTWQQIGQFFVCYAPLAGGTLALFFLTLVLYPSALNAELFDVEPVTLFNSSLSQAVNRLLTILNLENLATLKFWIYSYLVLAIGCHLAPSSVDYRESVRGHKSMLLAGLVILPIFLLIGGLPNPLLGAVAPLFLILQANFIFAVFLCTFAWILVYIVTELITWMS